ncbi:hypothetical protein F4777DRAFT_277539 [Nemania sp. FL0916]|nr:hypothetical protein F4777DRAFT_277539 [Nemania sp. FL0916]
MAAPPVPSHSTLSIASVTRTAGIKWLGALLMICAIASWARFSGGPSQSGIQILGNEEVQTPGLDDFVEKAHATTPTAAPAPVVKHTDRVAVIIEDRSLGNLIPVIFHFHSILGPKWPIILYTTRSTSLTLLQSASLSRAVASSEIEIRYLPANTSFSSHASVSEFLTSSFLWTDLAPYAKVLLFQADSILCAGAPGTVDEFMSYDLVGAPIDARLGTGYNGGLSLRSRELVLRVIERWSFAADNSAAQRDNGEAGVPQEWGFEDQWLAARMRELGSDVELAGELGLTVNLPDERTAAGFAVETMWFEGLRPLGYHQPQRWQEEHMPEIMEYCPEVGMIAGSSFFG